MGSYSFSHIKFIALIVDSFKVSYFIDPYYGSLKTVISSTINQILEICGNLPHRIDDASKADIAYSHNIKKYPIIQILKQKGFFKKDYKKNYAQSPQTQFMKTKNITKILKNIIYDNEFTQNVNFIKINKIIKKKDIKQNLAWQMMNIYFFFHTFKKFIFQKNLKKNDNIRDKRYL